MKKLWKVVVMLCLCSSLVACSSGSSKSESKAEYVDEKDIAKVYTNPDKYKGKYIKITGQLISSPEKDNEDIAFQMFGDPKNGEMNTIVRFNDAELDIKSDDYVIVDGEIAGGYEGENGFGGAVNALLVRAKSVKVSSYAEVMAPTIKEIPLSGQTNSQHGVDITINKIEFAKNETRMYYTITNNCGSTYNFYDFNFKIVQNGKQYEIDSNFDADYPSVSGEVLNGMTFEGIAPFAALEQSNFEIHVASGHSNNYDIDFVDYTVPVTVTN